MNRTDRKPATARPNWPLDAYAALCECGHRADRHTTEPRTIERDRSRCLVSGWIDQDRDVWFDCVCDHTPESVVLHALVNGTTHARDDG